MGSGQEEPEPAWGPAHPERAAAVWIPVLPKDELPSLLFSPLPLFMYMQLRCSHNTSCLPPLINVSSFANQLMEGRGSRATSVAVTPARRAGSAGSCQGGRAGSRGRASRRDTTYSGRNDKLGLLWDHGAPKAAPPSLRDQGPPPWGRPPVKQPNRWNCPRLLGGPSPKFASNEQNQAPTSRVH